MLDEKIHEKHGAVGDDNKDSGKGAGEAVRALLGKLIDLHRDEQKLRCDEQDDGGNCRDAAHEGRDEAGEEGILYKRQSDRHEHL